MSLSSILVAPAEQWSDQNYPNTFSSTDSPVYQGKKVCISRAFWSCGDLADHGTAVVDELGQHHGHVVIDGGGVVGPLGRVSHKSAQSKNSCAPHLQRHKHIINFLSIQLIVSKKACLTHLYGLSV